MCDIHDIFSIASKTIGFEITPIKDSEISEKIQEILMKAVGNKGISVKIEGNGLDGDGITALFSEAEARAENNSNS